MTLPEIIYDIKRIISGGDTTVDSKFLDSHLTQVVNQARAEALSVHYMQMREKRALSEAMQDFYVLQNSGAFRSGLTQGTDADDDLETGVTVNTPSGNAGGLGAGSQLYRRLKKYSIEASEGTIYRWNRTTGNKSTPLVTDVSRFTLPSPVLKFGRNNGFLSFTDHSYDSIMAIDGGASLDGYEFYEAPQLGGDHVRVVYGLKELRDLQKHKAAFPYKMGFAEQGNTADTGDSKIMFHRALNSPNFVAASEETGSTFYKNHFITLKNPVACVTNSDIFLNGLNISENFDGTSHTVSEIQESYDGFGWSHNEYFQVGGQYNHQYRRKDVVLLINTPLGKILPDDSTLDINKSFGAYIVSGIFADPTLLPNYSYKRSEYPIPQELLPGLKQNLIANQLMIARQIEEDLLNDGVDRSGLAASQPNVQPRQQAAGRPRNKA